MSNLFSTQQDMVIGIVIWIVVLIVMGHFCSLQHPDKPSETMAMIGITCSIRQMPHADISWAPLYNSTYLHTMTEDRLIEIEIKLTRQEDMLETLNQTVYQQQKKIDELETLCLALAKRMKGMADSLTERNIIDERPPHY
jgi:SlyX protein